MRLFISLFLLNITGLTASPNITGEIQPNTRWSPQIDGKYVNVLINSPGGSVDTMHRIGDQINRLQRQGRIVRCYVTDLAFSAAFFILSQCDERYTQEHARIGWHEISIILFGYIRVYLTDAKLMYIHLQRAQDKADGLLRRGCDGIFQPYRGFCPSDYWFKVLKDREEMMSAYKANWYSPCFIHGIIDPTTLRVSKWLCKP